MSMRTEFGMTEHHFNDLIINLVGYGVFSIIVSGVIGFLLIVAGKSVFNNEFGYIGFTFISSVSVIVWFFLIRLVIVSIKQTKEELRENIMESLLWK